MKEITITDIRGNDIIDLEKMGCHYEGLESSYGDGVFKIKEKLIPRIRSLYNDRIRKIQQV